MWQGNDVEIPTFTRCFLLKGHPSLALPSACKSVSTMQKFGLQSGTAEGGIQRA